MKLRIISWIITAFIVMFVATAVTQAEDVVFEGKVTKVSTHLDKNGSQYTRIIAEEARSINGTSYIASVPVMCFGDVAKEGKAYTAGNTVRVIADKRMYQGRVSYTARVFLTDVD